VNPPAFDAHRLSWEGAFHAEQVRDLEARAKAVRLVLEHRDDHPSEWAAITAVSSGWG